MYIILISKKINKMLSNTLTFIFIFHHQTLKDYPIIIFICGVWKLYRIKTK